MACDFGEPSLPSEINSLRIPSMAGIVYCSMSSAVLGETYGAYVLIEGSAGGCRNIAGKVYL